MNINVTQTADETEILYTEKEAAKKYRVSTTTLWRARTKKKTLRFYQVGRKIFYTDQQLQEFLKSCEQNTDLK